MNTNNDWFYPIEPYRHCGITPNNCWDYLACKLKSIHGSWHLIYSDGYDTDTRYKSNGSNGWKKHQMRKDLATA